MDKFFEKFPVKPSEAVAMDMMFDMMHCIKDKHAEKDLSYMRNLQSLYEMIEVFLEEKGYSVE